MRFLIIEKDDMENPDIDKVCRSHNSTLLLYCYSPRHKLTCICFLFFHKRTQEFRWFSGRFLFRSCLFQTSLASGMKMNEALSLGRCTRAIISLVCLFRNTYTKPPYLEHDGLWCRGLRIHLTRYGKILSFPYQIVQLLGNPGHNMLVNGLQIF